MLSDEVYDLLADRAYKNGHDYARDNHTFQVESPLSGEWADEPTWRTVLTDLGLDPDDTDPNDVEALCSDWGLGYLSRW